MATKAELYLSALAELGSSTADILTSAIVTLDGLAMASTTNETVSKDAFAAYSAAAYRRSDETMEELSGEKVDMLILESKNHRIFSIRTGDNALLITMTGRHADMGKIISEIHKTAGKVEELMK
ncbi:MAG: roadblock/LC7 domain-containing protein [Euryarchaeota archaeon]|nr:roadblock/LC7 domain-containing protein [Euryarchaeota archaeon]